MNPLILNVKKPTNIFIRVCLHICMFLLTQDMINVFTNARPLLRFKICIQMRSFDCLSLRITNISYVPASKQCYGETVAWTSKMFGGQHDHSTLNFSLVKRWFLLFAFITLITALRFGWILHTRKRWMHRSTIELRIFCRAVGSTPIQWYTW